MTEKEEYFFVKGTRHGLMVARELNDPNKLQEAINEMSRALKEYRKTIDDETDQLLEL